MKTAENAAQSPHQDTGTSAILLASALLLCIGMVFASRAQGLTLDQAIAIAQQHDPWIEGSEYRQSALAAQRVSAGTLPDPMISAGFANLPTDTFDFDQEAMTQFKVGISQALPRGDSRQLRQAQLGALEAQYPLHRADRRAKVATDVAISWLEAWRARESIRLIEKDRDLFEQLVDVAQSNYASAVGQTRQQDLIRAQLELTRLDDRLVQLNESRETALSGLSQWLHGSASNPKVSGQLPEIGQETANWTAGESPWSQQDLARRLGRHPAILAVDQELEARRTGVALAEQRYKPQWRLNASYGYREDDPQGPERADFFSLGVSFDVPLFTSKKQDQQVQSAAATAEAAVTERTLLLRRMMAEFGALQARQTRLEQRRTLYEARLLAEMRDQAEASLTAYTNDDGDFAEVVRAKIAELNARIDALDIRVDQQITLARLNYYLAEAGNGAENTP